MNTQVFRSAAIGALIASAMYGQAIQRQASIVGGGSPDRAKCTIEVVVDDVAQVEVRGTIATLRTLAGQPAQWRRFECTAPFPPNPAGFRFAGVDGRGRQNLMRDPGQGGVAVVQIEDKQGGSEGYTFDLFWDPRGSGGYGGAPYPSGAVNRGPDQRGPDYRDRGDDRYRDNDTYRDGYRNSEYYRRYGHGFSVDEAVRVCQQGAFDQASRRFRSSDIHFHRTEADDRPGRQDWVTGVLDVVRGGREDSYRFSCSMDFNAGRLRSIDIDDRPLPGGRR